MICIIRQLELLAYYGGSEDMPREFMVMTR